MSLSRALSRTVSRALTRTLNPADWFGAASLAGETFPLSVDGATAVLDIDPINNRAWSGGAATTPAAILTVTRASPATTYYEQIDGSLITFAANALRIGNRGILSEGSRTNVVLWSRDLTNAAWTPTNMTVAKDQTGPDGTVNGASSLTATAANATITQAITLASSARWQSARVKRLVGTGTIEMTMDNGTTWVDITSQVSSSWACAEIPTQTLANPTAGFRIATSGDSIAVDFVQNEASSIRRTSPIPTTTASVTRSADSISMSLPALTSGMTYCVAFNKGSADGSGVPVPALFDTASTSTLIFARAALTSVTLFARNLASVLYYNPSLTTYLPGHWAQRYTLAIEDNNIAGCLADGVLNLDTSGDYDAPGRVFLGSSSTGGQPLDGYIDRLVLFDSRLPDASVRAVSLVNNTITVFAEGDSITAAAVGWPVQARTYYMGIREVINTFAVSGSTFGNATASLNISSTTRSDKVDQRLADAVLINPSAKTLLTVMAGYNDYAIEGNSTSTFLSELQAYCTARKAAGHTIAVITPTPASTAGFNAWRATVRTGILALTDVDYIVDLDGVSGCADGDDTNLALYSDGIHPTAAQAKVLALEVYTQAIAPRLAA